MSQTDSEKSIEVYDLAIASGDGSAETHYKRGNALNSARRWQEALGAYDVVLRLDPKHAKAYCNRGSVFEKLNRASEALDSYDQAIEIAPDDFLAYYNRGSALRTLGRLADALESYDKALGLKADFVAAHVNRGNILQEMGRHEAASASYEAAIALNPQIGEAHFSLGTSLHALKGYAAAVQSYEKACVLNRDTRYMPGQARLSKMHMCQWDGLKSDFEFIEQGLALGRTVCTPFTLLALTDSAPMQRRAAEIWTQHNNPEDAMLGPISRRPQKEKIQVGYFSSDFRNHPVSFLTAQLFEFQDRSKFAITAFAFGPATNDAMTKRLQLSFDQFIDVRNKSDVQVSQLAREIGIDIAVDLGGLTEHSRSRIFALRAAPVQISYIGYLGTMGAAYMDYLVADPHLVPPENQPHFAEKIIYLPSYQVNDSRRIVSDRTFTRDELGLPPMGFVFCCLNSNYKITPDVFGSWMRILKRVSGSTMFVYAESAAVRRNLLMEANSAGVESHRLAFGDRLEMPDYLARYRAMELFLDTFPYNAGATASDALWAGLPVVTRFGQSFASRVATSLLHAIQIPELIAHTQDEYENLAVRLATRPDELTAIKQLLEEKRATATLFDTSRFTRSFETALTLAYQRYQVGLPPDHLYVG